MTCICNNISGGFGIDFSYNKDDVEAGVRKVAKGLLAHGVTAFCPTLVTSPPYVYLKVDSVNSFITLSLWYKYYLIFAKYWYLLCLLYCMNASKALYKFQCYQSFFLSPTDAQEIALKGIIKFTIKQL